MFFYFYFIYQLFLFTFYLGSLDIFLLCQPHLTHCAYISMHLLSHAICFLFVLINQSLLRKMEIESATANEKGVAECGEMMGVSEKRGMYLVWEDLSVVVPNFGNGHTKRLLNGLSGYAEPNKIMAIMGPSGSGKSTLLEALAGSSLLPSFPLITSVCMLFFLYFMYHFHAKIMMVFHVWFLYQRMNQTW